MKQETNGGSFRHPPPAHLPPPTTHPPPTHHPWTYPVLQYSNAAVRRAIHLTGEQHSSRFVGYKCSRAGRDLQLFTIPRHAGGQASRSREGDFHAPLSPRWGTDGRSFAGASSCCCADGGVAAPRGRRRPSGARESPLFGGVL